MRLKLWIMVVALTGLLMACGHPQEDGGLLFKTADPNFNITFYWPQPTAPEPPIEPEVIPSEEEGLTEPEPPPQPPCELIKGNISRDGRKLYHLPSSPNYKQVKIDEDAGEKFFCSEEEALAAGWERAGGP